MSSADLRAVNALLRGAGGAGLNETRNIPGGAAVPTYRGVPMFRNDFIPKTVGDANQTAIATGVTYEVMHTGGVTDWSAAGGPASGVVVADLSCEELDEGGFAALAKLGYRRRQ